MRAHARVRCAADTSVLLTKTQTALTCSHTQFYYFWLHFSCALRQMALQHFPRWCAHDFIVGWLFHQHSVSFFLPCFHFSTLLFQPKNVHLLHFYFIQTCIFATAGNSMAKYHGCRSHATTRGKLIVKSFNIMVILLLTYRQFWINVHIWRVHF